MKTKMFLVALGLALTLFVQQGFCSFIVDDDTIVSQTKQATLIVIGKVSSTQYVQPDLKVARVYTDVTIDVSKTLKGKPNINENTARFRIEGGIGIEPTNNRMFIEEVSTTPKFNVGQEVILFLETRVLDDWEKFYNGLYPLLYPPYPTIEEVQGDNGEYKLARFYLAFYNIKYRLNVPLDVATRLLENAIKAPEEFTILEEKIRPLKNLDREENQGKEVEPEDFLLMLGMELVKIEDVIKERENSDEK